MGLSRHPYLVRGAEKFMASYGAGSTGSRLICGNYQMFEIVERKISGLKKTEAAIIFNSGYQANATVIPSLADRNTIIFSDELNHNSIIAGIRQARCTVRIYRHDDLSHLEDLLQEARGKTFSRKIIVTETLFSMDGDISDLYALSRLAESHDAILVVDDAHATGVLGENGMGLADGNIADVIIGTFSKGGGVFGAYVACSSKLREYLINCCPGFIYTTALPPQVIGSIDAALDLIPRMGSQRARLLDHAEALRLKIRNLGLDTGASEAQIIPIVLGDAEKTLDMAAWLLDCDILASAIRPPTVPDDASRIRISLSALHTDDHLKYLFDCVQEWKKKDN